MEIKREKSDAQKIHDKNFALSTFISGSITLLGLIMTFFCLEDETRVQMFYCASYFLIFLFVTLFTIKTRKLSLFYFCIKAFMLFTELFYLKNGGSGGFGLVWLVVVPFFSVYLFDSPDYYIFNGVLFLILVLGLWTPLYKYTYDVGFAFRVRIPIIFLMEISFGAFLRYRIEKIESDLANQKNILSEEIKNAALIQNAFFSMKHQNYKEWSVGARNLPMIGVTGDLYCIFGSGNNLKGVGLFDISGHGISSGLLTMLAKNTIEKKFYDNINSDGKEELWETVDKINNQFIVEKGEVQNYLTGILIKINDKELELVNAGQPEPIVYRKKTKVFEHFRKDENAVGAIGISDFPVFYISQHLQMESGDELYLFTDGLTDCVNENGEEFGSERLVKSLKNHLNKTVEQQAELIIEDINTFRGKKVTDDLTLMILKKN